MEFRILGPLEMLADERALDLGGQKQRAPLALLLVEANRVVSSDWLIEALWEEEPGETAPKGCLCMSRFGGTATRFLHGDRRVQPALGEPAGRT